MIGREPVCLHEHLVIYVIRVYRNLASYYIVEGYVIIFRQLESYYMRHVVSEIFLYLLFCKRFAMTVIFCGVAFSLLCFSELIKPLPAAEAVICMSRIKQLLYIGSVYVKPLRLDVWSVLTLLKYLMIFIHHHAFCMIYTCP